MHCRRVPTPWPRSASRCLPSPLWWISGGTASRRIWSHSVFRPCGEAGCTSACFRSSIGHTKWPTHGARAGKPSCERPWRRCKARFKRMRLLSSWPRRFLRSGKRGLSSGRRRFSAPRLPWKGAMVLWHSCIIISEACPGTDTRCGPSCITSIVAPQMERPPRPGFSGGRFRISLRRFYPRSRYCLGLGNAMTMSCYVTDVMKCPALRGYPRHGERQACLKRRPAPMHHLFTMADQRQHREHRLDEHAVLPLTALTQFQVAGIPLRGMEAGVAQDNHTPIKLLNQPLKGVVSDIGRGTHPSYDQPPLIQEETPFPADNPPVIREAFAADLLGAAAFAHRMDQRDPRGVDDPEDRRGGQEGLR